MGYFSKEDLENQERNFDREELDQSNKIENFSTKKDKIAQQMLELEKKKYFARYGNKDRTRLYECEEEQEETDDLRYGR